MRPDELRLALAGLELIEVGPGRARVRVGNVDVTLTVAGDRMTAAASSPDATPLYLDAALDRLGALTVSTSDAGFADALLEGGGRARLERVLAHGGRARLAMGRWTIERIDPRIALRELGLVVGFLADRPRVLGERWAALARRLGVAWTGRWSTRGDVRLALPAADGRTLAIDVMALVPGAPAEVAPRLRTGVWSHPDDRAWSGTPSPIRLGGREGARITTRELDAAWLWGLCDDADLIGELARLVGGPAPAAIEPASATAASVAPMSVIDWPSARIDVIGTRAAPPTLAWTLRPMPGSDAVVGLAETVDVDGIAVRTEIVPSRVTEYVAEVRVRAEVRGLAPRVRARPGYHFLLAGLRRDDHLGDPALDERYIVHADDLAWVRWWLGATERQALMATFDPEAVIPFALEIADGAVVFAGGGLPPRRYLDAARQAAAFVAARAERAADEWRGLAPALGAVVRGAVWTATAPRANTATASEFALTSERGRAVVTIDFATALPFDRGGPRLRTCVHAPRQAAHRAALALERDDLPRRHRLRPGVVGDLDRRLRVTPGLSGRTDDVAWAEARLTSTATPLARAAPDVVVIGADRVLIAWEGVVADPTRLTAAIDLVAQLAVETGGPGAGPYR